MVQITHSQTGTIVRELGWRTRTTSEQTQAVKHFQAAYNLGAALVVDGQVGPLTSAALLRSYKAKLAGQPNISTHFRLADFDCTCGGRYNACARIWTDRRLLVALEKYRARVGHPISIVSGCRCAGRNAEVPGAATYSQHMLGRAADIAHEVSATRLTGWGYFTGIGKRHSDGEACHVDVRTSASTTHPDLWTYGSW